MSELLGGLILSSESNQVVLLRTWLFVGSLGLRFLTPRVMFKELVAVQRNDSRWLKICILLLSCNAFNTKLCVRIIIWFLIHSTIDSIHTFLLYPTVLVLQIFLITLDIFLFSFSFHIFRNMFPCLFTVSADWIKVYKKWIIFANSPKIILVFDLNSRPVGNY